MANRTCTFFFEEKSSAKPHAQYSLNPSTTIEDIKSFLFASFPDLKSEFVVYLLDNETRIPTFNILTATDTEFIVKPKRVAKRGLQEMMSIYKKTNDEKPYQITINITFSHKATLSANTSEEAWQFIKKEISMSLFRGNILGVVTANSPGAQLISVDTPLEPGFYEVISSTSMLDSEALNDMVIAGVERLHNVRPLNKEKLANVERELLVLFTHSSLNQEGSTITRDETFVVSSLLAAKDPVRALEDSEMQKVREATPGKTTEEAKELVNHLDVVKILIDLIKKPELPLDEKMILSLHAMLMQGLLVNKEEGLPGEYRKVEIQVSGSSVKRPSASDVPILMHSFQETLATGPQHKSFVHYLSELHTQFEFIHPFADGNGRMGRLIINLLALRAYYPVIVFAPEHRKLFCDAVEEAHHGKTALFSRMLLEAFYFALDRYQVALHETLLDVSLE